MKNRALRALLLGTALTALVAGALPAQAATVSWDDPKGDAKSGGQVPNEPAYDITKVTISNEGGNLTWDVEVPGMIKGAPVPSTGYNFRMNFTHGDLAFRFQITENALGEQSSNVALASGTPPPPALKCEKCEGKINREAKKVVFTAPLDSLDKALQSAKGAPLAGAEWTVLSVVSNRPFGLPTNPGNALPVTGVVSATDTATAPEGTSLQF